VINGSFTRNVVIDIFVIKIQKSFGSERFPVWEVYLGDIY
jgi:hypothetical protein